MKQRLCTLTATTLLVATAAFAPSAFADALRGTLVHEETIRVAPSADAARVGEATRGVELIILDTSRDWTNIEAILRAPSNEEGATEDEAEGKAITGWVPTQALNQKHHAGR